MGCFNGCLKNIFNITILVLAIIGIQHLCQTHLEKKTNEPPSVGFVDLSRLSDEYKQEKSIDTPKFKMVIAKHTGTGQKFIITNGSMFNMVTGKDFTTKQIDKKIAGWAEKIQYQFIRLENIEITNHGTMKTLGQNVPYIKFTADTVNLPAGEIKGLIGAIDSNNNNKKTTTIITYNNSKKYSQIITEQFFNNVGPIKDF